MNTLITIEGATAIGKTALAIQLAQHFNTHIISADSRQFYKEMNIGTAVPSIEELQAVKHYCIQHKSIHENYTVGDFEKEALSILNTIFKKNTIAIMVGGSGLYTNAVIKGLDSFPEILPEIRKQLNIDYTEKGILYLQEYLQTLDPEYYLQVDVNNPQRLIRAIEVSLSSGKPYSYFRKNTLKKRSFKTLQIALTADRDIIYNRINTRVDKMIQNGLLQEVESLYPYRNLNALQTVGYKELFLYLDGLLTLPVAIEEIKKNTRRFAKRQLTWLRKNEELLRVDWQYNLPDIISNITTILEHQT